MLTASFEGQGGGLHPAGRVVRYAGKIPSRDSGSAGAARILTGGLKARDKLWLLAFGAEVDVQELGPWLCTCYMLHATCASVRNELHAGG